MVFVFSSNLAGQHGNGAALTALKHYGAIYGQGTGLQGRSYAIPTKNRQLRTLSLERIAEYVAEFLEFAKQHPEMQFEVTKISCGLAGYKESDIKPMFKNAPYNCHLPDWWR